MPDIERPRLRNVESFPAGKSDGEPLYAFRDPEGFATPIILPLAAAILASFMDGRRTLADIQADFQQQLRQEVELEDLQSLVEQLDQRFYLDTERFRALWKSEVQQYLNSPVRPPAHAGKAYLADPAALRKQLADLFTAAGGPGVPVDAGEKMVTAGGARLCGVMSPHIDFQRGGPAFAWAYKKLVEESDADLFIIFGTAHKVMSNFFSVTRKHFDTPLGTVETDKGMAARLAGKLTATPAGKEMNLAADELAHRHEHSIEFQAVFLQYLLGGKRPFKILPVLVGSFHDFVAKGNSPADSLEVQAFTAAMKAAVAEYPGKVCYIGGVDLAHIGQRFGDRALLDRERLQAQATSDRQLLDTACRADAAGWFAHIANERDRNRVCGLSPTYTMLQVMQPVRGELLKYDQAVELDGTSCVSFGSVAFYEEAKAAAPSTVDVQASVEVEKAPALDSD